MVNKNDSKLYYLVVGKNIKKYRDIRNHSLQTLAEKVGLTKKTIQRYENGEIRVSRDRLLDISLALNISVQQLTEGANSFLGLDIHELDTVQIPIVGKISCGNGAIAFEYIEGYEQTPKSWLNGGEYFYLRAKGDSMTGARVYDGDLLLIRKQEEVEDGEIAAVLIDEEAVLKRVYRQGNTLVLQSENPNYPPIICEMNEDSQVRIIGRLKKTIINY